MENIHTSFNKVFKEDILNTAKEIKTFNFTYIHINKIFRNQKNKYSLTALEELSQNIKENSLLHNITVVETTIKDSDIDFQSRDIKLYSESDSVYKLISGERRFLALMILYNKGEFDGQVPCNVLKGLDDIEQEIALISGNKNTRVNTQEDISFQISRMEELLREKGKRTGKKTSITNTISELTGLSSRTVDRYRKTNNNLIPKLKALFDKGEINLTEAELYSGWDEDIQLNFYNKLMEKDELTKEELSSLKQKNENLNKLLKNKNNEIKKINSSVQVLEKDKLNLSKVIEENSKEIIEFKLKEESLRAAIMEEERNKNSESMDRLNTELDNLVTKLTGLQEQNGELGAKLRESEFLLQKKTTQINEILDEQRSLKYQSDLANENDIIRKTLKKENVKRAFEIKEEIIKLIMRIDELDFLEDEQRALIYDDLKAYCKIIRR